MILYNADNTEQLKGLFTDSVDAIITDPPYGITFMGKKWDDDCPSVEIWQGCYKALKAGGHMLAFSGTRTMDLIMGRIREAGFEVRDTITWLYASGFPKSLNISKSLEKKINGSKSKAKYELRLMQQADLSKAINHEDQQGQALQQSMQEQGLQESVHGQEPKESTQDGKESGMEGRCHIEATEGELQRCQVCALSEIIYKNGEKRWLCNGTPFSDGEASQSVIDQTRGCTSYRPQSEQQRLAKLDVVSKQQRAQDLRGQGTALKPACEFIVLARKPLSEKSVVDNVLKHGTGGINIDECRVEIKNNDYGAGGGNKTGSGKGPEREEKRLNGAGVVQQQHEQGRFPANLILDEEAGAMLDEQSGNLHASGNKKIGAAGRHKDSMFGIGSIEGRASDYKDKGGAARFFQNIPLETEDHLRFQYVAKASKRERNEGLEGITNSHPTVKPQKLMQYLCKLITPPKGVILDPFMGSGSTGVAATSLGFDFIGIEREKEYFEIAKKRIESAKGELFSEKDTD